LCLPVLLLCDPTEQLLYQPCATCLRRALLLNTNWPLRAPNTGNPSPESVGDSPTLETDQIPSCHQLFPLLTPHLYHPFHLHYHPLSRTIFLPPEILPQPGRPVHPVTPVTSRTTCHTPDHPSHSGLSVTLWTLLHPLLCLTSLVSLVSPITRHTRPPVTPVYPSHPSHPSPVMPRHAPVIFTHLLLVFRTISVPDLSHNNK